MSKEETAGKKSVTAIVNTGHAQLVKQDEENGVGLSGDDSLDQACALWRALRANGHTLSDYYRNGGKVIG